MSLRLKNLLVCFHFTEGQQNPKVPLVKVLSFYISNCSHSNGIFANSRVMAGILYICHIHKNQQSLPKLALMRQHRLQILIYLRHPLEIFLKAQSTPQQVSLKVLIMPCICSVSITTQREVILDLLMLVWCVGNCQQGKAIRKPNIGGFLPVHQHCHSLS